jgi:hypothetical protein
LKSSCIFIHLNTIFKIMATKTVANATAAPAAAAGGGAQILQSIQTLTAAVAELKTVLAEHSVLLKKLDAGQTNLGTIHTSMEHKLTALDVSVKAVSTGVKRQPKAPAAPGDAAATGGDAAAPAATAPAGEKFASNTQVWLSNLFKADAAAVKAKYFSEAQLTTLADRLAASDDYKKNDADVAAAKTDAQRLKAQNSKLATEFRTLWAIAKEDKALEKNLQNEWRAAKSEFEKQNRTPASKDASS